MVEALFRNHCCGSYIFKMRERKEIEGRERKRESIIKDTWIHDEQFSNAQYAFV